MPSIASILPPLPRLKIVDVGAMWTGVDSVRYAQLENALPCEIIGFEPVETEHKKLIGLNRPNHRYFPYIIGDGSERTFFECRVPFTSSLFEPDPSVAGQFEHLADCVQVARTHQVQTKRLDDIPETAGCDFLKVDVQGAELMVFDGAPGALQSAVIIDVEADFIALYKNQPLFADVDAFLRAHGFSLHQLQHYGLKFKAQLAPKEPAAASHQVGWGDAVYVRDFPRFERLDPMQLLKLAAILHENYRSYDLAARVLAVHDRKARTDLRTRYGRLMAAG